MNRETLQSIITICAICIYIVILITTPFRGKYIQKKAGKQILAVHNKPVALPIFIIVLSGALIILLSIKKLEPLYTGIISVVAILGAAFGTEEAALHNKCGVYENGLIGEGHFLPLKEIYAIPELSYTEEERKQKDGRVLHITTDRHGSISFAYKTPEERKAVIDALLTIAPDIKR